VQEDQNCSTAPTGLGAVLLGVKALGGRKEAAPITLSLQIKLNTTEL
jgi:hypothetical protein